MHLQTVLSMVIIDAHWLDAISTGAFAAVNHLCIFPVMSVDMTATYAQIRIVLRGYCNSQAVDRPE